MPARLTAPDARRDRRIPRKKAAFAGKPSLSTALEKTCTVCATGTVRAPRLDAAAHNKVTTWSRSRGSTVSARRALMNRRPTSTRYCWVAGSFLLLLAVSSSRRVLEERPLSTSIGFHCQPSRAIGWQRVLPVRIRPVLSSVPDHALPSVPNPRVSP